MGSLTLVERPAPPEQWGAPIPLVKAGECDLSTFDCGQAALDSWLHQRARSGEGKHVRTYLVLAESGRVVGYHSLAVGHAMRTTWPTAKLRRNAPDPIPVLTLGRLAVDQAFTGHGIGSDLLQHALRVCLSVSRHVGVRAMVVQPNDDRARAFYTSAGFLPFLGETPPMFLPIEDIEQAAES